MSPQPGYPGIAQYAEGGEVVTKVNGLEVVRQSESKSAAKPAGSGIINCDSGVSPFCGQHVLIDVSGIAHTRPRSGRRSKSSSMARATSRRSK